MLLDVVFETFFSLHLIPVACALRLRRVSRACKAHVEAHYDYWRLVYVQVLQYSLPAHRVTTSWLFRRSLARIPSVSRCIECASKTKCRVKMMLRDAISNQHLHCSLCSKCYSDAAGYRYLIDRRTVHQRIRRLPWRVKTQKFFPKLHIAKMSVHGAHFYWSHQVDSQLNSVQVSTGVD